MKACWTSKATEKVMRLGVRARRKAERPGEILEAAFEEFVQKGYAATRLEDVAARAGVTKGTIYVYFANKEALFVSLVRELTQPIHAEVEAFLTTSRESTPDFLRTYLRFLYGLIANNQRSREVLRLLIAEASRFPELVDQHYQECMGPVIELVRDGLRNGAQRGEIRDAPAIDQPEVLLGPAMSLSVWLLLFSNRKPIDMDRYFEAHIDLLLNGLLPRPASP
jgi:AcrR family transcriptional regulator